MICYIFHFLRWYAESLIRSVKFLTDILLIVHAPGPKVTIEIQFAQDDFNFLGYKLGERLEDSQVESTMQELHLRGLKDTKG